MEKNYDRSNYEDHQSLEEMKYRELFRVTDKCHSSMDINFVLAEIIYTLKKVFPDNDYFLLLSNDYDTSEDLPIKNLEYNSDNVSAIAAYVNAAIEIEYIQYPAMYAPLKGKQGVYGVLQVTSRLKSPFEDSQIDFIRLLANTAGNALENAKLYQQSQKLIEDLRMIDEITQKLNSTSSLTETMDYLHQKINDSFHASHVGFVFFEDAGYRVWEGSSPFFLQSLGNEFINLVLEKLENQNDSLFMGEVANFPESFRKEVGSLIAIPLIHNQSVNGIVLVVGDQPYSFSFEMFRLLQSLIQRSSLAIANSMLLEKLEKLVITDHLTQLYARNYMNDRIEQSMKADRQGTFILIDLDDFKAVNDTYGHQVGDQVLIQVADLIRTYLRPTDIGARWGGEELAVYLPGVPLDQGLKVAERLRSCVSEKTNPSITLSCGVSNWVAEIPDEVTHLFSRADTALYKAKNSGKNKISTLPATESIS